MKPAFRPRKLTVAITAAILAGSGPAAVAQVDLSQLGTTHPGFRIDGDNSNHYSGSSVSGVGDFEGDGLADVITGAPQWGTDYGTKEGKAYIVFDQPSGNHIDVRNLGANGFDFAGVTGSDYAGNSVSGVGDLDGDGLTDLVIGAYRADTANGTNSGEAYVIFGGTNTVGFKITGPGGFDAAGTSVSGAGDLNGDGFDDIVVGVPNFSTYMQEGMVAVLFGNTRSNLTDVDLSGDIAVSGRGFKITGDDYSYHGISNSVSGAGDVNGDGFDDLIFESASFYSRAYVVFGSATPSNTVLSSAPGFRIDNVVGTSPSLAGAGDVNGDGLSDLIVGQPLNDTNATNAGAAFVLFGKDADTNPIDLNALGASEGFQINGAAMYDQAGTSVAGAGDVNGDGFADVLVGVPNSTGNTAGRAFLVFGKNSDTNDVELSAISAGGTEGIQFDGEQTGDKAGFSVSSAGDVNGDGLTDTIIGAKDANPIHGAYYYTYNNAGKSYVVFSNETAPAQATYQAKAKAGDAPILAVGVIGDGSNSSSPDSRMWIDFADGSNVSTQNVTIHRAPLTFGGDGVSADIHWQVTTDRTSFSGASIAVRYTDAEISGIDETKLTLFQAPSESGPFTPLTTDRSQISANLVATSLSNFSSTVIALGVAPEINLENAALTSITDGGTDSVGNQTVGTPLSFTYTIQNQGSGDLTVGTPTAGSSSNVSSVTITSPTSPIGPGGSATFDVQFEVDINGAFSLPVSFTNGDADESPYDFTISGTGVGGLPEFDLLQGASPIADGGSDDLGNQTIGTISRTYRIENNGRETLNVSTPTASGFTNVENFSVTTPPASTVAPSSFTDFTIQFDVPINGAFNFGLSVGNDDSNENPYDVAVFGTGTGGAPEVDVQRPAGAANSIPDAGMDDLGPIVVGPASVTYTVENTGTANLTLDAPTFATANNVSNLAVSQSPGTPVPPGGTTTFSIDFSIDDFGAFGFDIDLGTNDSDEANYDITVFGEGSDTQQFDTPMDLMSGDQFGMAVASFGNLFAVGIPGDVGDPGRVIVYRIEGTTLIVDATIDVPAGFTAAQFGASLDLEGDRLLVGAPGTSGLSGKALKGTTPLQAALFQRAQGQWTQKETFSSQGSSTDDQFGASVSLSGGMVAIGAPGDDSMGTDSGAAYIFEVDEGDNFVQGTKVMPPSPNNGGNFGASVSASQDKFAVGAPGSQVGGATAGTVSMFQSISTNLANPIGTLQGSTNNGDQFGSSVSLDGGTLMVGAPGEDDGDMNDTGAAYLFGGDNFTMMGSVKPDTPEAGGGFGTAVALSGGKIAIGAPGASGGKGNVSLFGINLSQGLQQQVAAGLNQAGFGTAVAIDPQNLVVGAPASLNFAGLASLQRDPDVVFSISFE